MEQISLKQLRIIKGLNQSKCADYLGISLRSYQNYENNLNKINTIKYKYIYQKLELFGSVVSEKNTMDNCGKYNTNVVTGYSLKLIVQKVRKYEKRDCFNLLRKFEIEEINNKIAILYGLRRTGKTTLLFQMINELPENQVAYIKITTNDNMSKLTKDLDLLCKEGYMYIFIDEITLMDDFINTAALLSDIFAQMGMKIVVSGTDSLGFAMANSDELYDRNIMIHTSFIPFREYYRLLNIRSIDSYIEYGGTLKMENMTFDDPDFSLDEVCFKDDESTRKYIDSAISRNIQHTLKNNHYGEYFNQLKKLYDKGELTNVINRIVENMNHDFLLSVIKEKFKSNDLGSAKELLLHEYPREVADILYNVDEYKVIERLKVIIDIKEQDELSVELNEDYIKKVKKYLFMLDLIAECKECYETGNLSKFVVFSQPGMRYAIAKALVYSLMQDVYFSSCSEIDRNYITKKILNDVKGRMLEDMVLLETSKTANKNEDVFKFKFDDGGEYDMVIYDRDKHNCSLFEIKHSDKIHEKQTRYLRDEERLKIITHRFGNIKTKYVIYRGNSKDVNDIKYLNCEEYLNSLEK